MDRKDVRQVCLTFNCHVRALTGNAPEMDFPNILQCTNWPRATYGVGQRIQLREWSYRWVLGDRYALTVSLSSAYRQANAGGAERS